MRLFNKKEYPMSQVIGDKKGVSLAHFEQIQAVFIDLDGTLVDSAADILRAVNFALYDIGIDSVTHTQVRLWVGRGASRLIQCVREYRGIASERHDELLSSFLKHYQDEVCVDSTVYAGVREFLDWCHLNKLHVACITNKPYASTLKLLKALNLLGDFSLILGGDSLEHRKPHPAPLLHALAHYGVKATHAVMIGDSRNDIEAARAAAIPCIAVRYGYNHGEPIAFSDPDLVLDSLAELL
jgi:phosphoglycolate phosphatase